MTQTIIKDFLVYIPYHDNTPQRMRLRITDAKKMDEILFQIERQLVEDQSTEVKKPLEPETYMVLLLEGHDHALIPFESATFEVISNCSSLLLQARPVPHPLPLPAGSEPPLAIEEVAQARSIGGQGEDGEGDAEALEQEAATRSAGRAATGVDPTTATMLHVVERLLSHFVAETAGPEGAATMSEHKWLSLTEHAMEREHISTEQLNPCVVEAFKKTVMAAFEHRRGSLTSTVA